MENTRAHLAYLDLNSTCPRQLNLRFRLGHTLEELIVAIISTVPNPENQASLSKSGHGRPLPFGKHLSSSINRTGVTYWMDSAR